MILHLPAILAAACAAPALLWTLLHLLFRSGPAARPYLVGHRGAGGLAPENTLAAVREGVRHGADMVEIDIQRTADGVLVAFHDETLERTTNGRGLVRDARWEDVRRLDAGGRFGGRFAGEPVPTLESILEELAGRQTLLMIEVKNPEAYPGLDTQLAAVLRRSGLGERALVGSFDHAWLRRFHGASPETGLILIAETAARLPSVPGARIAAVNWKSAAADPFSVRRVRGLGLRLQVWTVDSPGWMRFLLWLGVEGITTNRPDRAAPIFRPGGDG